MSTRICAWCGGSYEGAVISRYCSDRCKLEAKAARLKKSDVTAKGGQDLSASGPTCAYCGGPIIGRKPTARYCSDAHKVAMDRERKKRKGA